MNILFGCVCCMGWLAAISGFNPSTEEGRALMGSIAIIGIPISFYLGYKAMTGKDE